MRGAVAARAPGTPRSRRAASRDRPSSLHPLGGTDAEQIQAVAQHLARGVVEPPARAMQRVNALVAERDDAAVVVPPVIEAGELFQVEGGSMRLAPPGGEGDDERRSEERRVGKRCGGKG